MRSPCFTVGKKACVRHLPLHDIGWLEKRPTLCCLEKWAILKLTFEVDIGVIEEENFDRAPVVGVDDASASVDEVLGCKPTARGYTSICAVVNVNISVCKLEKLIKAQVVRCFDHCPETYQETYHHSSSTTRFAPDTDHPPVENTRKEKTILDTK